MTSGAWRRGRCLGSLADDQVVVADGVVAAGAGGPLAAPLVDIAEPGQPVVAHPRGGDDRHAGPDGPGDERVQRGGGPVGQHRHPAPADPSRLPDLYRDAGEHLLARGPAAAQPWLVPPDVALA